MTTASGVLTETNFKKKNKTISENIIIPRIEEKIVSFLNLGKKTSPKPFKLIIAARR